MKKISVKDYADLKGISSQAVYKQINLGKIRSEKLKGRTFILIDDEPNQPENIEPELSHQEQPFNSEVDLLRNHLKSKEEENAFLKDQILVKDQQIRSLSLQLENIVEWQKEATASQKQSNTLIAGLQRALGLLEERKEAPVVYEEEKTAKSEPVEVEKTKKAQAKTAKKKESKPKNEKTDTNKNSKGSKGGKGSKKGKKGKKKKKGFFGWFGGGSA